jgi:hypothetical protein
MSTEPREVGLMAFYGKCHNLGSSNEAVSGFPTKLN